MQAIILTSNYSIFLHEKSGYCVLLRKEQTEYFYVLTVFSTVPSIYPIVCSVSQALKITVGYLLGWFARKFYRELCQWIYQKRENKLRMLPMQKLPIEVWIWFIHSHGTSRTRLAISIGHDMTAKFLHFWDFRMAIW